MRDYGDLVMEIVLNDEESKNCRMLSRYLSADASHQVETQTHFMGPMHGWVDWQSICVVVYPWWLRQTISVYDVST